jgi:nucleotide-binding universal stress UspA family protein
MTKSYKRILAPLDGSQLSEQALEDVKAVVAGRKDCLITLLMVVEPILKVYLVDYFNVEDYEAAERKYEAETKEYLISIAEEMTKSGTRVEVELIVGGTADEAILDYTKENDIDLIIMSTHGRSGVHRWIFGSVAQRVLRHSPVPVLIVPPTGFRND